MLKPRLAWLLVFVPVAVVLEIMHADLWIEGAQLVAAYLIMAVSFFFL